MLKLSNCRYAVINAKLKGMHSNSLTKDDIRELMKQNDLKNAIFFLKNELEVLKNIDETSSRDKIEEELSIITINDIIKIERLLNKKDKEIFNNFIAKYEIRCIKEVLRDISRNFDSNFKKENIDIWTSKIFKEIKGVSETKTLDEFLYKIRKTNYYNLINDTIDEKGEINRLILNDIEIELDKFYFEQLYKNIKKHSKNACNIIGEKIDLLNIEWIYRIKKNYIISKEEIEKKIINISFKINNEIIKRLINAKDFEEMKNILSKTAYAKIFENVNENEFSKNIQIYLYKKYEKVFQSSKYDISTIFAYMLLQEYMNKNIIVVLEGLNYNVDKEIIDKKLIV